MSRLVDNDCATDKKISSSHTKVGQCEVQFNNKSHGVGLNGKVFLSEAPVKLGTEAVAEDDSETVTRLNCSSQSTTTKTSTALWVMNHARDNHDSIESGSSSPSKSHALRNDSHVGVQDGVQIDNRSGEVLADSRSGEVLADEVKAQRHAEFINCEDAKDGSVSKYLTRSKSANLKNSADDLSSVASSQTRIRLQLKRVKLFSLRKFRSKPSMNSSSESIGSEDSDSMSFNSSFVSLNRPSFPVGITSPNSKSQTRRSPKSPLQPYNPHPAFNSIAGQLLSNRDNNNTDKIYQDESAVKSASDSTLLDDITDTDSSTTEDEGITDVNSPPPSRHSPLAMIPTLVSRTASLPHGSSHSRGSSHNKADEPALGTKRKNGRVKLWKTHPPATTAAELDVAGLAKDTNNFHSFPAAQKQHDLSEAKILSNESLFESNEHLSDDSPLLAEMIGELTRKPSSTPAKRSTRPAQGTARPAKSSDRGHKSEPFPKGTAQQFIDANLRPQSPAAIARSVHSLPLVYEEQTTVEHTTHSHRKAIVEEIIASEEKYVRNLEQISQAVKEIEEDGLLEKEVLNTIFYDLRLKETAVHHFILLDSLKKIVANNSWDPDSSTIGSVMYNTFHSSSLRDNYLAYVSKCERSKELMKSHLSKNAAFDKFNERFKLKNRSGLHLKEAVTLPANRLSSYLMFLERYLKYTPTQHPDYQEVPKALEIVKSLLDTVGKVDDKSRKITLKNLEVLLDVSELVAADREFIRVDTVSIPSQRQDFRLWMFSDLILITINKRNSSRKDSSIVLHGQHGQEIVPGHRSFHKLYKRVGLEDTEVLNSPESEVKKYAEDMTTIESDLQILRDIQGKAGNLSSSQQILYSHIASAITKCEQNIQSLRQRTEDTDLSSIRLLMQAPEGGQEYRIMFRDSKTRSSWEKDLLSAKHNLEAANYNKLPPEFIGEIPVDKTRAGMQFTCAASSMTGPASEKQVWFCNSDSSAGHLCRMSASSNPSLIDCVPLPGCSSRVVCICATPSHNDTELHIFDSPSGGCRLDTRQSLMWLGCEDGSLYLLPVDVDVCNLSTDCHLIVKCKHSILSIVYMDGKVFVSLTERKILVFKRAHDGLWDTDSPHTIQLNSQDNMSQLLPVAYKIWCACADEITILDPILEQPERSFKVSSERTVSIQAMSYCRQGIVAVSLRSSCDIKLFHSTSLKPLADINVFSTVAQKLNKCDEIIRQHKMACLKITSLVCCKHMLWIGTTAGVVLTLRLPKSQFSGNNPQQEIDARLLNIDALDIGHTGNVRFLAVTELLIDNNKVERRRSVSRQSLVSKMLVISGGDGYEVIDPSKQLKETVGFNDSINHLLVWKM